MAGSGYVFRFECTAAACQPACGSAVDAERLLPPPLLLLLLLLLRSCSRDYVRCRVISVVGVPHGIQLIT
jgi:hypothetical protein